MKEEAGKLKPKRKKRIKKKIQFNWKKISLIVFFFIAQLLFLFSNFFVLKKVEVEGNQFLKEKEIISSVNLPWGQNLFFINRKSITEELAKLSWVKEAKLSFSYPDKLVMHILERKPKVFVAFKNENEEWYGVSEDGVVLGKILGAGSLKIVDLKENNNIKFYSVDKINNVEKWRNAFSSDFKNKIAFFIYSPKDELFIELNFDGNNVAVYIGDSENFEYKIKVLNSMLEVLKNRKIVPKSIDLRYKEPIVKLK